MTASCRACRLRLPGLLLVLCGFGFAAADDNESTSARMLKRMERRVASLNLQFGQKKDRKIELIPTAVLRYSNPGGLTATTDATVWLWGKSGRPAAINAIFFEQLRDGEEKWSCELTSLAEDPLALAARPGWKWNPAQSDMRWQEIADGPAVGETASQRLRQMKELARRFSVSETFNESQTDQLRLLIQPLHRYTDPEHNLLDGVLFAFANGTNPEALLLLECRGREDGGAAWHFAFARMSAAALAARLDGKAAWDCGGIKSWKAREPYFSMFGTDAEVFGEVGDE